MSAINEPRWAGDNLAAVKIPGGGIPWDTDIDFVFDPQV